MAYTILTPPKPRDRLIKPSEYIDEAPPGCVLWLKNRRSDKIWYDESGHGNHVTINGATWTAKGIQGPAVNFDGVDDYAMQTTLLDTIGSTSFSLWLKCTGGIGAQRFFMSKTNVSSPTSQIYLSVHTDERLRLFVRSQGDPYFVVYTSAIELNKWYHYVAIYEPNKPLVCYLNTTLAIGDTPGEIANGTANQFYIGTLTPSVLPFPGYIDEFLVFNRALSAAEIRALYEQGRP